MVVYGVNKKAYISDQDLPEAVQKMELSPLPSS